MDRLPYDVFAAACPSRQAFDQIFSRWGILVLGRLTDEPVRFGTLARSIGGISEKMLAQTLKALEDQGLVTRTEHDERPPRVEYALTPAGQILSKDIGRVIQDLYRALERSPGGPPDGRRSDCPGGSGGTPGEPGPYGGGTPC